LAKRNRDIGDHRTRLVCRMHALLLELSAGGIAKEINASDVDRFLAALAPTTPAQQVRYDLAVELLDDIRRLDAQLKASHKRIRAAIAASGTTLTDLFGIGPIIAAMLIGYSGDIGRFANRDRYAASTGTAPVEFSSGGRTVHRLSQRGNRNLNHARTWPSSASYATPAPMVASMSIAAWPRAEPRRQPCGPSSAT
jgi:transposase